MPGGTGGALRREGQGLALMELEASVGRWTFLAVEKQL